MSNKPLATIKDDQNFMPRIVIWPSKKEGKDPSFQIEKQWKDKQSGEYKKSNSFYLRDLKTLLKIIPEAIAFVDGDSAPDKGGAAPAGKENGFDDDDIPF